MVQPPSGTVTFLFTDIEGSTKRWEAHPQQMDAALFRHDAILSTAIEQNGGYIFKTMGDAFCAAFATPLSALHAALDAQRALVDADWGQIGPRLGSVKVRMALHTGMVDERNGDYFGQPLNRVARLLSAGHGGQMLLSRPTYDLVRDTLPQGVSVIDLGEHRLKDLTRPEHIFQALIAGLPADFPHLKTLDYRPNNLPAHPTALIGREKELEDLSKLLARDDVRLVTLTGPGGIGKTRLALQVAADMLDDFQDGVWFVNLAPIADPNLVISNIAQVLGVKEVGGQPLVDTLKTYLNEKHSLLLVDNLEQVISAATSISELVAGCPHLKVLVTSRIALRLRGEREYLVPSLRLPDARHLPPFEGLTQYEAVRLFIERAQGVKADFEVNNHNAPSVAAICIRLDGLPLAIELAAARIRMFPPQIVLSLLSSRLKVLTGGARDLPTRQQTLRKAFEWSYELLADAEKQFFCRMAVFNGGCALEAIEAVCSYDAQLHLNVLEGLEALISNSLLQQDQGCDAETRFWMLETIREYASEKLEESGEGGELRKRHADYFIRLAEEVEPELRSHNQVFWLDRLEEERGNLRAVLDHSPSSVALHLAATMWRFWFVRNHYCEGRERLSATLSRARAEMGDNWRTLDYARAQRGLGWLAVRQGDYGTVQTVWKENFDICMELGDKRCLADSLYDLSLVHDLVDRDEESKLETVEQSLAIYRELKDRWGIAEALFQEASALRALGSNSRARALLHESATLSLELGHMRLEALSYNGLGNIELDASNYRKAQTYYEQSLNAFRRVGDKEASSAVLYNLGELARKQGDYIAAREAAQECLLISRELGAKDNVAGALVTLGFIAQDEGNKEQAGELVREALNIYHELGSKSYIAWCLIGLAGVATAAGQGIRAASLTGAARSIREKVDLPLDSVEKADYARVEAAVRAQLDKAIWRKAREEGRAMSMEEAIEYALQEG